MDLSFRQILKNLNIATSTASRIFHEFDVEPSDVLKQPRRQLRILDNYMKLWASARESMFISSRDMSQGSKCEWDTSF